MNGLAVRSFRLENFKAVQDSGTVRFTPLTVFIGNNGAGKSSLIEGLETIQAVAELGLDDAMNRWRGFEYVWNQAVPHKRLRVRAGRERSTNPIRFRLRGAAASRPFSMTMEINASAAGNELFIQREHVVIDRIKATRDAEGYGFAGPVGGAPTREFKYSGGRSILDKSVASSILGWQFLSLTPEVMGEPRLQRRTSAARRLARDGSNIAEYLLNIRNTDIDAFNGIVETLQYVLPYVVDIQPAVTSELERSVFLQLKEGDFTVPGWLLSTGTLRVLAILALLRHPSPPPLIVIEEIENGLDPRTMNLIVDEIRNVVEAGRSQVVATTHSPYLMDLPDLDHLVLVERVDGQPTFTRPSDQAELHEWAERFSPGQLYTMNRLQRTGSP